MAPTETLAADPRWEKITPRMCLTHSTGLNNFWFAEPDKKFHIHYEPGSRYSYSGDGLVLLQFAIEHGRKAQGLGLSVGDLTKANFDRLGMKNTSLIWRDDFASNLADGWDDQGKPQQHDERSKVRASGSMDTTISDLAKFAAALVRRRRPERILAHGAHKTAIAYHDRASVSAVSFPIYLRTINGKIYLPGWGLLCSTAHRVTAFSKAGITKSPAIPWSVWKPVSVAL